MKQLHKLLFLCAFLMVSLFLPFRDAAAQASLGVAFGSDTSLGLYVGYARPVALGGVEGLRVGIDGAFYLPETESTFGIEVTSTYFEVNLNGRYSLVMQEGLNAYALGGLNYSYTSVSSDLPAGLNVSASAGDVGLNVGGGAELSMGFGRLFGEAKFVLGGFGQLGLATGLRFGGK